MKFFGWVSEQVSSWGSNLRSAVKLMSGAFFPSSPAYDKTALNYDLCRQLYRNDGVDSHLGGGFCKPIIDTAVSFIGVPIISVEDEQLDTELNNYVNKYWKDKFQEMFRNAMRDSKTIVRLWQPLMDDPLTTDEERRACRITIYEPERVKITYDPRNPETILEAIIVSQVDFPDAVQPTADPPRGAKPQVKVHEIWEVITPDNYRFYDKTDAKWLDSWSRTNPDGFVPMLEVYNEYDSSLTGGQSEFEGVYPFIKAFHETLLQALKAHKYHSIPKLKFKVEDITGFLRNNFPDTIAEDGTPIPGASIKWQGREVLIMGAEDDLGFIEMKSVLTDSKVLLEFLIDCISIASETPEWAFMRVEGGTSQGAMNAQTIPFEKKIERKRINFQSTIQMICKMCLAINGETPVRPEITWDELRIESVVAMAQAIQQITMSLEVLLQRKLISDNTAREGLRTFRFFRKMKTPEQEAKDAQDNVDLTPPPPVIPPPDGKNGKVPPEKVPAFSGQNGGGAGN